ncbi:MAG: flagellar assembly protein FliX [Rhabdaerophilum sp.]
MRIIDQRNVQSLSNTRNARGSAAAGGARFTLDQGSPTAKAENAAPAAILGGLEALIAIQSEDTTKERRRRGVRRGQGLLDLLDELKIALLAGHLPADLQARLAIAMRDESFSGDPRLDSILEGIDLRAAVELAKLRQAARG